MACVWVCVRVIGNGASYPLSLRAAMTLLNKPDGWTFSVAPLPSLHLLSGNVN